MYFFDILFSRMCFALRRRIFFKILISKMVQTYQSLIFFQMYFALQRRIFSYFLCPRYLRFRRFNELFFNPPELQNYENFLAFPGPIFFFIFSLLPANYFFISRYCRKFDFQTSFDIIKPLCFVTNFFPNLGAQPALLDVNYRLPI